MTYFPPPHQPPQGPLGFDLYRPPGNPHEAAHRAGILMFVLAGLLMLCGIGIFAVCQKIDWNTAMDQSEAVYGPEFAAQLKAQGQSPQMMERGVEFWGVVGLVLGIAFVILGTFVMRASVGAIVCSIIVTSLIALVSLCPAGVAAFMVIRAGPPALVAVVITLLPLVLCLVLLFLLAKAAKGAIQWNRMQEQMRLETWQSQQQQARQANTGLGYGSGATGGPVPPQQAPRPQHPLGPLPPPPDETSK